MKDKTIQKLTVAAMLLAVGMVLPFLTGQIKEIGNMLLPMHLPVLLCGLICGWQYGGAMGLILPLLRSACFGMPLLYPNALSMSAELAVYGLVIGLVYTLLKKKNIGALYIALLSAMVAGRLVWGGVQALLIGLGKFTLSVFWAGAVANALPGIVLQLVLVPTVVLLLQKSGVLKNW